MHKLTVEVDWLQQDDVVRKGNCILKTDQFTGLGICGLHSALSWGVVECSDAKNVKDGLHGYSILSNY